VDVGALLEYRSERDAFLVEHYASPLPEEYQGSFEGLDCFEPDAAWVITEGFESVDRQPIPIPSTAGTTSAYTLIGIAVVAISGTDFRLAVIDDGDVGFLLPFRDATAGSTTYSGGRYLRPEILDDDTVVLDFNRASNPWCVYDPEFECPLPPPGNVIPLAIEAGARMWNPPA